MNEIKVPGAVVTPAEVRDFKRDLLDQCVMVRSTEAAKILDCTPRTINNLVRSGRLQAYGRGGVGSAGLRFLARDLREYVNSIRISRDDFRE